MFVPVQLLLQHPRLLVRSLVPGVSWLESVLLTAHPDELLTVFQGRRIRGGG